MSLTSFLEENADVRARFLEHFHKPDFRVKAPLIAPPLTESYGLVGTAFDYLLRFYIQKLNPSAKSSDWVAHQGLALLRAFSRDPSMARKAQSALDEAERLHGTFLRSRNRFPKRELVEATVKMARLDVVYRIGLIDPQLFAPVPKLLRDDLEAMLALVKPDFFRAQKRCILNPTFGAASELVRGADADLIIDDILIDVKTGKHLTFEREIFNQIIGYYVLLCIGGVDGCARPRINHVGVYYARYGILHTVSIADCIKASELPAFLRWFTRRARQRPLARAASAVAG